MPAGRPPVPTALKLLRGNPGKRRINQYEPHPEVPRRPPPPPKYLKSPVARAEWRRRAKELHQSGVLTVSDTTCLAMYCADFAHVWDAEDRIGENGWYSIGKGGSYLNAFAVGYSMFHKLMADRMRALGLDPSARVKLAVPKPEKDEDPNFGKGTLRSQGR